MPTDIPEIKAQDFLSFSRETPAYVKLEQMLIDLGGKGVKGTSYKMNVLNAAGWNYGKLISYGAHPEVAASAFNIIRSVFDEEADLDEDGLLSQVEQRAKNVH